MTRVEAPSRLHFGLLSVPVAGQTHWPNPDGKPGLPVRSFGGVGLMIDKPGVVVEARPAKEWASEGMYAERALAFAKMFVASLLEKNRCGFHVRVERCPQEHVGLGVGTSLGLSVAKALAVELGRGDWDSMELARRIGRGKRSAVGVHGFQHGGLIVEAGKLPHEPIAPMVARYAFPEEWPIVLFQSEKPPNWYGDREQRVFSQAAENNDTALLCRIVLTGLVPALASRDFAAFAEALYEFNLRAGSAFQRAQGGPYASAAIEHLITKLRNRGAAAGQSSWGPTAFAIFPNKELAQAARRMTDSEMGKAEFETGDCAAANCGCQTAT